jgi:hypothetical protein
MTPLLNDMGVSIGVCRPTVIMSIPCFFLQVPAMIILNSQGAHTVFLN